MSPVRRDSKKTGKHNMRFKPLWAIHNATYRNLVRGQTRVTLLRYAKKVPQKLHLLLAHHV